MLKNSNILEQIEKEEPVKDSPEGIASELRGKPDKYGV